MVRSVSFLVFLLNVLTLLSIHSAQPTVKEEPRCLKKSSFVCDENISHFPESERISIEHASETISNLSYENTYVDFTVSFGTSKQTVKKDIRLVACGCEVPDSTPSSRTVLFTKPTNIYVQDGPALFMMTELFNVTESLPVKYVGNPTYIFSQRIHSLLKQNKVFGIITGFELDAGSEDSLKKDDDMSVAFVSSSSYSYVSTNKFFEQKYNRPLLPIAELNEVSPLARAEWLKILALVYNRTSDANTLFEQIVEDYEDVKEKASKASRRPSVFFNYPRVGDSKKEDLDERYLWTQPGKKQYITEFIRDANADYRYYHKGQDNVGNELVFSEITSEFASARVLLNSDPYPSRNKTIVELIKPEDGAPSPADYIDAMKNLDAIRCGNVWSVSKRSSEATDFYESGVARPDLILKDYVKILHPDVNIGNHQLFYMLQYVAPKRANLTCPYVDFLGDPSKGSTYVEKDLKIEGLDRFEVQDQLEANVYPALVERNIQNDQVDVQFRQPSVEGEESVDLTVRVRTATEDAQAMLDSTNVTDAFKEGLKKADGSVDVTKIDDRLVGEGGETPTSPSSTNSDSTPTSTPPPSSSSSSSSSTGLGGGAIAGIVIAVLIAVIILVFVLRKFMSRNKYVEPEWDGTNEQA